MVKARKIIQKENIFSTLVDVVTTKHRKVYLLVQKFDINSGNKGMNRAKNNIYQQLRRKFASNLQLV